MNLLTHSVALTIGRVTRTARRGAVSGGLAGYDGALAAHRRQLGQVTKAGIVEAVREGVSENAAAQLAALKKPAMAEAAERLLADKGWLPQRAPEAVLAA
jgi:ParB family transcriptional regulator, chromosome partitioning protein